MRKPITRRRAAANAFTLIELLVVIVILAILATMVITRVTHRVDDARETKAMTDITSMASACEQYKLDTGHYPPSLDCLVADVEQLGPDKWKTKYINSLPRDPWDASKTYNYVSPGEDGRDFDITVMNPQNGQTLRN